ncbi:MAG TPA: hypothetical protein VGD57_04005 [Candidatus Dormibacteraeota bacterium]|jgi:hypothetical protein
MTTPTLSPGEVDRRLASLAASVVLGADDSRALTSLLTFRVEHPRIKRRQPLRLAAGLALAVLVIGIGNLAAAYYAPTYGQALAATPVLGGVADPLLHGFGLTEQNAVAFSSRATSNGHTIRLVTGYADGLRTVMLLEIDGRGLAGNPKQYGLHPGDYGIGEGVSLTDQFGHSYKQSGVNGPTGLQFEPLGWPASKVGARLTMHVTGLTEQWLIDSKGPNAVLAGDWTLNATLLPASVRELPLPAPVRTADGTFTVTMVRRTGSELQIRWTLRGPINDRYDGLAYSKSAESNRTELQQLERRYFSASFFDASGQPVYGIDSGGEWDNGKPFMGTLNLTVTQPGRYRLQLANALTSPDDQRWIAVP